MMPRVLLVAGKIHKDGMDVLTGAGFAIDLVPKVDSDMAPEVPAKADALLLAVLKRIPAYDAAVRGGDWGPRDSLGARELSGRRMRVMGFGRIGRQVARRARAFDVDVAV